MVYMHKCHMHGYHHLFLVRNVLEKYVLDQWRKDIKKRYTVMKSNYNVADARPNVSRYARIIKKCYNVATNAASCDDHVEDMVAKLSAMTRSTLPTSCCNNPNPGQKLPLPIQVQLRVQRKYLALVLC
ncbi:hypothetical protein I3843_04G139800 [Carya illinoinensis]|nr:hypothetical protein I3843_04G139800 [Carya illinoinensis]